MGYSLYKIKSGFTLIDLLLAFVIFAVISALIVTFAVYYFKTYQFSYEENLSVGLAQQGLTRMIKEIREARIAETGAYPVITADDFSFSFYSDVTNDGLADQVRYFLDNQLLKRSVIEPVLDPVSYPLANEQITIVSDYVDTAAQPLFLYYNGNWPQDTINNPLPSGSRLFNTRFVTVNLKINIKPLSGSLPFEMSQGVQIRGLKDNL